MIQSKTAAKVGWGKSKFRSVSGLTRAEKTAVRDGKCVWFRIPSKHHTQSGYKVATHWITASGKSMYASREPTKEELEEFNRLTKS